MLSNSICFNMDDEDEHESEINENELIKVQAFVRGKVVKKWFQEVRTEYEKIVSEIEGSDSVTVHWPSNDVGLPKFRKQKKKVRKGVQDITPNTSARNSPTVNSENTTKKSLTPEPISASLSEETTIIPVGNLFTDISEKQHFKKQIPEKDKKEQCTIETQTSIEEESFSTHMPEKVPVKETTSDKSVKTYDMLIQTDDPPDQREVIKSVKEPQVTNTEKADKTTTKQCLNREMLEQKINKFESHLQTLKGVSQQHDLHDSMPVKSVSAKTEKRDLPEKDTSHSVTFSESTRGHKSLSHHESVLTNVTSVWDSFNSDCKENVSPGKENLPTDPEALKEMRKNISMELLWVQQAIDSRKNYLKLKNQMTVAS